jgi:tetratricopeptide (TPR) repeat protein
MGRPAQALQAFDRALSHDHGLRTATFRSRWLAACAARSLPHLKELSREYTLEHPDDPMGRYYRGWALIEEGNPSAAVSTLIRGIESAPHPPAVLWFALGWAYVAERAWQEAVVSFETAYQLVLSGDTSLALHTDRPAADLCGALGRAYLGAGRCAEAETMLNYAIEIGAPAAEYRSAVREARVCQTPTPTPPQSPPTTPPAGD